MNDQLKQNWESYVGFQRDGDHTESGEDGVAIILYLKVVFKQNAEGGNLLSFDIFEERVKCELSFDEMIVELEKTMLEFPLFEYESHDKNELLFAQQVVKIAVAKETRRGVANVEFKNALFYRGSRCFDAAIFVAENDGKYGIFKHPLFNQYGRVIVEKETE